MNINYTFPIEETDSTNYYFYEQGFNKDNINLVNKNLLEDLK